MDRGASERQTTGGGGETRPQRSGTASAAFGPSAHPGRCGVRAARAARGRRRPQRPGTSRPKQGGATASGTPSGPSLTWGCLETPKARSVLLVAELPPLTRPLAAAPSALAPSAGVAVTGPRCRRGSNGGRVISPSIPPRKREPPSRGKTPPGRWDRRAQKEPPFSLPASRLGKGRPTAGRRHRSAQCASAERGGAGTWEGAERSGVGAQGPVAHPRHELQAEDLL